MIRNHLLVALRGLRRQKGYAALNVAGLAVGLACCGLILLYAEDELGYDRFHEGVDRVFRVVEDRPVAEGISPLATAPAPLTPLLQASAAVEDLVRLVPSSGLVSAGEERRFQEDRFFYADSSFFDVFGFQLVRGDAATALTAPFSVVLTEGAAARYFGDADPVGQVILFRTPRAEQELTVTGVVRVEGRSSHLAFDLLASFTTLEATGRYMDWREPATYTYVRLRGGAPAAEALEAALPALVARLGDERAPASRFALQPVTAIHLRSHREREIAPNSHASYVALFMLVALGVLLIACVNFMNLATARAAQRAKEVGVRKALGARRSQLAGQFLAEAVLLAGLAAGLAVGLAQAALPLLNGVADKRLALNLLERPEALALLVALALGVGLLSGSYPALYLSAFRPVRVLKGLASDGRSAAARLRRGLTVAQFALSVALLVGVLTVHRQLDFVREERLGFDKERVVVVPLRDLSAQQDHAALKAAWEALPGVEHVAASSGTPGISDGLHAFSVAPEGAPDDTREMLTLTVDYDFAETLGLQFVAGRDFDAARPTDAAAAFMLNESAARALGWADDPVGRRLTLRYWYNEYVEKTGEVVGVVRDFQYHSLRQAIEPVVLHVLPGTYYNDFLSARLAPGDAAATLAAMAAAWDEFSPARPFEYTFLDEQFDALYRSEARLGTLTGAFALLAVFVACLGLFGMATYVAERRTKEVGIRKVLGATTGRLVGLLAADLLKPVLAAIALAAPVAYWAMSRWLEGFAYRIALGPDLFILAGGLALVIALATVSIQALRAASSDPVRSLRTE